MFRYLALVWNPSVPTSATTAQQLGLDLQHRSEWNTVLHRPGLQISTTGIKPGINDAFLLQGGRGIVLGKLFRRSELNSLPPRKNGPDSSEAVNILDTDGRALVSDFWGRYVAFVRTAAGGTCVLRDPSGTLPCFRIRHRGVSIVFSWLEDVLELIPDIEPPAVNWDALTAQLLHGPLTGRETTLASVSQVLPGERLDLDHEGSTILWSAAAIARTPALFEAVDAAPLLRQTVQSCTRAWASCYDALLMRLSGGVDSSILLSCLAANATRADVICVNYFSPGSDSDERYYARLAVLRIGREIVERPRDVAFRITRILEMARMPDPVAYIGWMNASADARLATGFKASAMFTGAGGDSLFFEYPRWWPAADYLRTSGLNAGFAAAAMDAARLGRVSVWRAIALALQERVRPNPAERAAISYSRLLAPDITLDDANLQRFIHPDLHDTLDLPIGKYTQTVALMHPLGYYDPFEQASAPELVNPLLSQPLVELCLRLPTYVLTQGGRGRALARNAFTADLPRQIVRRRSKGGMEEHIKAVLDANLDFIRGMLLEGQLARRGLIDRAKVEELLSGKPTVLAGHVSQIHGLVAVEAWLSRWTK